MPISFSQINQLPDILANDRHLIFFPVLDGVDGSLLSKMYSAVTLPSYGHGHIIVKILGFSVGHRGNLQFENQLSVTFHDTVEGAVTKSIRNWINLVRDPEDGTSQPRNTYAVDLPIFVYDTVGKAAIEFTGKGVFPLVMEAPTLEETSAPYSFAVQFNIDDMELA